MAVSAYGTSLKFTPAGGVKTTVGRLTAIGEVKPDSEEIDVTTLDSAGGYREYAQGYRDAGALTVEGFYDRNDAGQAAIRAAYDSGSAGDVAITFRDGAEAAFSAYVKSYSLGAAKVDGAVGFSATFRITGAVTYSGN